MRGDLAFRVYGVHEGREEDTYFGAFRSIAEAQKSIAELESRQMHGENWAARHHNRGFEIRPVTVETDFEIPPLPKPRDKYAVRELVRSKPDQWRHILVEVFRRDEGGRAAEKIAEYERNYALLSTFEPFRQGGRELALISRNYTRTEVLDLSTGEIVAQEPDLGGAGFCPVGFYVPDWWDVHDDSIIPGSKYWDSNSESPNGHFGFVWGCVWGDDNSWKIQYLDLSRVSEGVVGRHDRFGYVELATYGFDNPCFKPDVPVTRRSDPPPFIVVSAYDPTEIMLSVEMRFGLADGKRRTGDEDPA
jgi:hypothetical protein